MLKVYRSNRTERLVDALADLFSRPLGDPIQPEWIAVPGQGMRSWLGQRLADQFGIFSNVRMPFPRDLICHIFRWILGDDSPDTTRFEQARLTWSIMAELTRHVNRREFEPVARFIGEGSDDSKLYQLSRKIAGVFDEYALYRPELVDGWERRRLDDDWQPVLWNAVGDRICRHSSASAEHVGTVARRALEVLDSGAPLDKRTPERIVLFGITSLPPLYTDIVARFADRVDVHLFLLDPSQHYWGEIARRIPRDLDLDQLKDLHYDPGHPLLASLGRLGRDFQSVLETRAQYCDAPGDLYVDPVTPECPLLLHALQSDILELRYCDTANEAAHLRRECDANDGSIALHSCHSPLREVEVLKDQLLALFDDRDLELRPEDVAVMTPQLERYGPIVKAVFGDEIPHVIRRRGLRQVAPVVDGLFTLLELVGGRAEASALFDFISREPVRANARLSEADIELARRWSIEAGIRWGVDAEHRERRGQPGFAENTWRFALDRMLMGYAMQGSGRELFADVLPYDGVEGASHQVLGRFVELCEELLSRLVDFERPRPIGDWVKAVREALAALIDARGRLADQHAILHAALAEIENTAAGAGFTDDVDVGVIRAELDWRLAEEAFGGSRSGRGGVVVAGIKPLRGIPFRVVCLLGLNDGALPRSSHPVGFDLMVRHPRVGDRSARDDDRGLFLDALLSARDRLIISYTGQDLQANEPLPPSVLVSELLDAIDEGFIPAGGSDQSSGPLSVCLTVRHPLQPFSRRYFEQVSDRDPRLFSYDAVNLAAAQSVALRTRPSPFLETVDQLSLEPGDVQSVRLVDLKRFFKAPADYFLTERLGVLLGEGESDIVDREPFELSGLAAYRAGERLLAQTFAGVDVNESYPVLRGEGVLPLGVPGRSAFEGLLGYLDQYREALEEYEDAIALDPLDVGIDLNTRYGPTRVVGALGCLLDSAHLQISFGRKYPYRLIQLWLDHLVLNCVAGTGEPRRSLWIGRSKQGVERVSLMPVDGDPRELLAGLVELYWVGQEIPLPFFPWSSLEFAYKMVSPFGKRKETPEETELKAMKNARGRWDPTKTWSVGEGAHPANTRLFAGRQPFDGDEAIGPLGFKAVALAVYGALLGHLERFTMGRC